MDNPKTFVDSPGSGATASPAAVDRGLAGPLPTHQQIAERAYMIYLANGAQDGRDLADWFAAEQSLRPSPAVRSGQESIVAEQYEEADLEERTPG